MSASCKVGDEWFEISGALLGNTTSISEVFKRSSNNFELMHRRKAFAHSYLEHGFDWEEMSESLGNLRDLISEYESYSCL